MKKGFALLETVIVITFLTVSLLMLYKTFSNMVSNSEKNILYDDASNIYKTYYAKEYLGIKGLNDLLHEEDVKIITCADFAIDSCDKIWEVLNIENIYLTKFDLKEYNEELYTSNFNNYVNSLSNKDDYKYRFIVEFKNADTYSYASLGMEGNND